MAREDRDRVRSLSIKLHAVDIYIIKIQKLNTFIDYMFEYNQQINSATARNRTENPVVFLVVN